MSEKVQVARTSAIAGGTLAMLKLIIGLLTGSLALISEGIHSSLDFGVAVVTWLSVRTSDLPADQQHHYGHGKIESLSAFGQAVMLGITAFLIIIEAYKSLVNHTEIHITEGWYAAIAVIAISIGVDLWRTRALMRAAKKFNSQALEADAMHFGTELLSSGVVLIGLIVTKLGARMGNPRFAAADPLAAMCVAGVMIFTALRLGRKAADVLIDRAPEGLEESMQQLIRGVPGVRDVSRVRARQSGANTFVDATIRVDPSIGLAAGHRISDSVELRVTEEFPNLDILVHVEPATDGEDHTAAIRELAEAMKMSLHAIRIREIDNRLYINFHAEFPPTMTLADAHRQVTELEERIHQRLPTTAEIDSHMEPLREGQE